MNVSGYSDASILNRIDCSDQYQSARAVVRAVLSTGASTVLTDFTLQADGPLTVDSNEIVGTDAGEATVFAEFDAFQSDSIAISVLDDISPIIAFEESTFGNDVFSATPLTQRQLNLNVILEGNLVH